MTPPMTPTPISTSIASRRQAPSAVLGVMLALATCIAMGAATTAGAAQEQISGQTSAQTSADASSPAGPGEPTSAPYADGGAFDPAIPTLEAVIGHRSGEKITRPADAIRYMQALAAAAPERIKLVEYARTWEGRPLVYAIIAAPERLARIDAVKAGLGALSDPRATDEARAEELISVMPSTVWLSYGVHGNEISSTDAALAVAYHLLAARDDATVRSILQDTVVFIDPMQNPDGRNRFVTNFENAAGLEPSGSRIAAERNEPWPRGRTNHYLFDMNRDWIAQSQPEVKGRTRALLEWRPLVVVDAHEMGTDESYYFAPEAEPINPYVTDAQMAMADQFGRGNAAAFDAAGFDYFTRDVYDKLFPGYGDSWPAFYGAIAMTFEQGSARGLRARRTDGAEFSYRDSVHHHVTSSIATLKTAAAHRERLLRDYWTYQQTGLEEGRSGATKAYIFPAGGALTNGDDLAASLLDQGLDVHRATTDFAACGKTFAKGAFVASMAQPRARLLRTLLDPTSPMKEAFVAEQEKRRARGLEDEIYDVTAWSPALALNVGVEACSADPTATARGGFSRLDAAQTTPGAVIGPREAVAYAVEWGDLNAIRFLAAALREGIAVRSADGAFTAAGHEFPSGSLIFVVADHDRRPEHLRARLLQHAEENGVTVRALASTYLEAGDNFGSDHVKKLIAPRIAIAWDEPTNPNAAGATRFVIERRFGYPATPVRVSDLADKGLYEFDVLILPDVYGSYTDRLGARGVAFLKDWTSRGGVLIAMDHAARFVGDPQSGLSAARRERAVAEADDKTKDAAADAVVDGVIIEDKDAARAAIVPSGGAPDPTSGVFAHADVDHDHWMSAGAPDRVTPLVRGGDIYRPLTLDEGVNVVRFAGAKELLAGGYLWEETRDQLAYKPFLLSEPLGDGLLLTFTQDPTFRAQLGGLDVLVANAIFRAPAHTGKLR
ncbi:MAG: peptidase [Alphaproteobacteria bacterium]|nr:peptidase [Alphaproteobacteria bacterium]